MENQFNISADQYNDLVKSLNLVILYKIFYEELLKVFYKRENESTTELNKIQNKFDIVIEDLRAIIKNIKPVL